MKPNSSQIQPPGLYIVATPIGNLQDITWRAVEMLKNAELIACEDTRVTAKLLSAYGISKKTISYNDHSDDARRVEIFSAIENGRRVALVSDAGTPLVSDPGYKLVRAAIERGYYVTAMPGASSVMAALCLSGLPSDRFFYAGFLPAKKEALKKEIAGLAKIPATIVIFESAKRVSETLRALCAGLGDRKAAIARELTKLYEECRRGNLSELCAHYDKQGEPKGEIVIVIAPPGEEKASSQSIEEKLSLLLSTHSVKEAASIVAEETGAPRKEVYSLALKLMKKK